MSLYVQVLTILVMFGISYLGLLAFGPTRTRLLYTSEERKEWDALVRKRLGSWMTITAIVGTLTSFATVFVFFLGNTRLFGVWIFTTVVTIASGSVVTNYFTKRILSRRRISRLLESPRQTGGVIATLFWREDRQSMLSAQLVKWISILNILGVIWLEFALITDIGSKILRVDSLAARAVFLSVIALIVFYFTLKFGVRGLIFADIFQTPLIALGTVLLILGTLLTVQKLSIPVPPLSQMLAPMLGRSEIILFVLHVIFLNLFLVVVTEPHWLRAWIFRQREIQLQVPSLIATAVIWSALIIAGFAASLLAGGKVGEEAIVSSLQQIEGAYPLFLSAFWIAGVAALFSTTDAQVYSFLVVREFDVRSGEVRERTMGSLAPLRLALWWTVLFVLAYILVRILSVPIEKLIFLIIPSSLNVLPGLVQLVRGRRSHPALLIVSILAFVMFSIIGLLQPASNFDWTLAAALVPVFLSIVALFVGSPENDLDLNNEGGSLI